MASYNFNLPRNLIPGTAALTPYSPPPPPPPQIITSSPMPYPMTPPPFNPDRGGRVRVPEPEDNENLSDLMQYYQPQPPMYVTPMPVNPAPSMFGGVTMSPGPVSGYVPPIMVGPGQPLPTITSGQGVGPDPRYRPYTPPPAMDYASPAIERMPMPRPMPPPPPFNPNIGGRIRNEEPEPEGNAFFTL